MVGNPTKESVMFDVGLSPTPVYRDGLTTDLSYLFLAVIPGPVYRAVVYGRGRLKFYPNAEAWGVSKDVLTGIGKGLSIYDRTRNGGYEGVAMQRSQVPQVLNLISTARRAVTVTKKQFDSLDGVPPGCVRESRRAHPQTHYVPKEKNFPKWDSARVEYRS